MDVMYGGEWWFEWWVCWCVGVWVKVEDGNVF